VYCLPCCSGQTGLWRKRLPGWAASAAKVIALQRPVTVPRMDVAGIRTSHPQAAVTGMPGIPHGTRPPAACDGDWFNEGTQGPGEVAVHSGAMQLLPQDAGTSGICSAAAQSLNRCVTGAGTFHELKTGDPRDAPAVELVASGCQVANPQEHADRCAAAPSGGRQGTSRRRRNFAIAAAARCRTDQHMN